MKIGLSAEHRTFDVGFAPLHTADGQDAPAKKRRDFNARRQRCQGTTVVKASPDRPRKSTNSMSDTNRLPSENDCTPPLTGGQEK